jgi:hypothetical protein
MNAHLGKPCTGNCGRTLTADNLFRGQRCKVCRRAYLKSQRQRPEAKEAASLPQWAYRRSTKGKAALERRREARREKATT